MTAILKDLRVALRQHRRQPGFAATVVVTLALAIGATAAVFSVVNAVLMRALPFASPGQLVWIASIRPDNPSAPFTLPEFMDYRSRTRALSGLAAYANWSASLAGDGITERLTGARMSANAFDVLGIVPAAGRLLNESDDRADAPQVVLLSHRLWQRQYGGAADAVGRAVRINGESFVIVGVLPAHFRLPLRDVDLVTALVPDRDPLRHARNSVNFLRFFGRLAPAVDAGQARAELNAICGSLRQQFPVEYARKDGVHIVALHDIVVGDVRQPMLLLLAAVIAVLAAAVANLVSLALVRANGRATELSTRMALGASRLHLTRQLSLEALLLSSAGTALGWLLAIPAVSVAVRWAPRAIPRLEEVRVDRSIVWLAVVIAVAVTVLLTLVPLGTIARTGASAALRSARTIGDRWNHQVRNAMVVAEIAAALVLVLATIVLVENMRRLRDVDLGFTPDGVFLARVSIPPAYRSPGDVTGFFDRLSDRLAGAPGVERLGLISVAPMSGLLSTVPFSVDGQPIADRDRASANLRVISPAYPAVVGTRLLAGRLLAETDRADAPPVALVSAGLAERFVAGSAIGRSLLIDDNNQGPRPVEIVGIVENVRHVALDLPPAFDVYLPLAQIHPDNLGLVRNNQFWAIRTGVDAAAFHGTFVSHLRAVDPEAAVSSTGPMRQYLDEWLGPRRFTLGLFAAFALTAVLLAVSGLYGLVSYAVSQRAQEIGLRIAIGATERDVHRMVLRQAARLGICGAAAGACLTAVAQPFIATVAPDVPLDFATFGVTAALLMTVVLVAAWLPARRAARIEPSLALRAQ